MKYFEKNYRNQAWMIALNVGLMGIFFLLSFAAGDVEFIIGHENSFLRNPWFIFLFVLIFVSVITINILCFTVYKYKSVKIHYILSVILAPLSLVAFFVILGVASNSDQGVTKTASRILFAIIGCIFLNGPLAINLLANTCYKCFHYRSISKTGTGTEDIKQYVKGWTETKTVGKAEDMYGNTILYVEQDIYHPGHTRIVTEKFNKYTCFVCGNRTRD